MRPIVPLLVATLLFLAAAGCTQQDASSPPVQGSPLTSERPSAGGVSAAYFYLFDGASDAALSAPDQIPWSRVNRVYIGFATVKDGILTDLPAGTSAENQTEREANAEKIRRVVALCREANPDAEILITSNFGGTDIDDEYRAAAEDPQKFAESVVSYVKAYDLDGYDMDWESPNIDDYAPQLTSLLSACKAAFASAGSSPREKPYIVTHTVWPGVESPSTVAGLKDAVDQVNIMSYGPGDTYDLASYADSYNASGLPYDKMIGGLESESGYAENGGPDTQASVAAKCTYVKQHGLAGLFEWRMDNDMRPDNGPPTYPVTGWMNDCIAG